MKFDELVIKRRSVRRYTDQCVNIEFLKDLIKTSTLAPSAGNMQPWKFIIISDKKFLKEISDDCKSNMLERINSNPNDFAGRYKNMLENPEFNIFYNAPALVIILGDAKIKNYMTDCTLAASYFMFAAAAKGLGTCWINFAMSMSGSIKERIGVPKDYKIVAPLVLGYPAVKPEMPKRKEPELHIVE